jgi:hypothetical protein
LIELHVVAADGAFFANPHPLLLVALQLLEGVVPLGLNSLDLTSTSGNLPGELVDFDLLLEKRSENRGRRRYCKGRGQATSYNLAPGAKKLMLS